MVNVGIDGRWLHCRLVAATVNNRGSTRTYKTRSTGTPTTARPTPKQTEHNPVARTSSETHAQLPSRASNAHAHRHPYPHIQARDQTAHGNWATAPRSCVSAEKRTPSSASRRTGIRAPRHSSLSRLPMLYPPGLVTQARANSHAESRCRCPGSAPGWTTLRPGGERVIATGTLGDRRVSRGCRGLREREIWGRVPIAGIADVLE